MYKGDLQLYFGEPNNARIRNIKSELTILLLVSSEYITSLELRKAVVNQTLGEEFKHCLYKV